MSSRNLLTEKADHLTATVEEHFVDRHGLILSFLDHRTMTPFAPGFFTPEMDMMRHPTANYSDFGAYLAYENSGMCTGAYLCALIWQYRVTRDRAVLERARRTFEGLSFLYEVSQEIEPGFFCKFHEGKITEEMSSDQCLYAMVGLDRFRELATPSEADRIREIIGGIAGMWIRKSYKHPYRDRDFPWPWPPNRFPAFCWLAWKNTGDDSFRREFLRLSALPEVRKLPPFVPEPPWMQNETRTGCVSYGARPEHTASAGVSLDPLLEYDAPERTLWLAQLRLAYESGAAMIGEDGLCRGHCNYDLATGQLKEVEQPYYAGGRPNPIWRFKGYHCDVKSGHGVLMFARAAFTIDLYHPDLGAASLARRILDQTDLSRMLWLYDHKNQLPPDMQWMTHALSGDSVTNWLWAYWMGRGRSQL